MKKNKKPAISIIIPLKNTKEYHRETKRLKQCLDSLKNQTIPYSQIDVVVADIDSDPYYKAIHKKICNEFKARHVYSKTDDIWNISRARNIGIRSARADYVMTTDVDCIFAPNFIETILRYTAKDKIVHCRISDLPEDYKDKSGDLFWMNKVSTLRPVHGYGGCQVFPRKWVFKINGFDEAYKGWGADDTDFFHRATQDGLESIWIEKETSFFHQWHPMDNRFEDREQVNENRLRLKLTEMGKLPIVRNDSGWGGKKGKLAPSSVKTKKTFRDTAVLITTFMRDDALFQCIKSIRKHYPDIAIFVGDNGKSNEKKTKFCKTHKCTYIKAPFDCGVGATRNAVFKALSEKHKYVVICEDDIIFTDETRLDNWQSILSAKKDIGIIGGMLKKRSEGLPVMQNYEAWLYTKATTLHVERLESYNWKMDCDSRYAYCDIVINIFMMKREVWDSNKWDKNIKTWPEHEDFFLSLKKNTGWKIAYTDTVSLIHEPAIYEKKFENYRMRRDGEKPFSKKWGIEYIWNSWHAEWGMPNPLKIGLLIPEDKKPKQKSGTAKKNAIAIGIKTFLRENSLFKTLDAIEEYFPFPYRLYIVDDGKISDQKEYRYQQLESNGHMIIRLPYNCGISVGRNKIIENIREEYLLLMDDDIVLQDGESIIHMKNVLDSKENIGLCSGMLFWENGNYVANENYQKGLRFEFDKGLLFRYPSVKKMHKTNGSLFLYADQVVNFFIAKKAIFNEVKWDDRIKVEWEHIDFFLSLQKTDWEATVCLDAKATHLRPEDDHAYIQCRRAMSNQYFLQKNNIHAVPINRF